MVIIPEQARENRAYVRALLQEKQPEFAAALEQVAHELATGCLSALPPPPGGSTRSVRPTGQRPSSR